MLSKSRVKYIQSLQHKKFRDEYGVFIAEGPKLLSELLQQGHFDLVELYALQSWLGANDSITDPLKCNAIDEATLAKLSALSTPNEVIGIFKQKRQINDDGPHGGMVLALDGIQDPGNLGTIIRTADWYGIKNMYCSMHTADIYNPKVVQSTMASIGRVAVSYTNLMEKLPTFEVPVYAASLHGKPMETFTKIPAMVLLIGNESKGISKELLSVSTELVTISRKGSAESLNAAVAAGILMQHFA